MSNFFHKWKWKVRILKEKEEESSENSIEIQNKVLRSSLEFKKTEKLNELLETKPKTIFNKYITTLVDIGSQIQNTNIETLKINVKNLIHDLLVEVIDSIIMNSN